MNKSIFSKFFVNYLVVTLISFSLLGLMLYSFLGNYAVEEKQYNLVLAGKKLSDMTASILKSNSEQLEDFYDATLDIMSKNLDVTILLADTSGSIKSSSSDTRLYNKRFSVPKDILKTVNENKISKSINDFDGVFEVDVLVVGTPIKIEDTVIAGVYLIADIPELSKLRKDVLRIYLISVMLAFFASFMIILLLSKRITDPIKEISKAAKKLASGDFTERVRLISEDEIGQLADTFNEMADSLEKLEDMRRNFISDVSHELRTPMTTITGFVEGVLDETIPPEKQKFYLKIVLDESKRLSKLVNDLLDISRISSDQKPLELSHFDINELIRLSVIGFESRFNEKKLEVNAFFEHENEMVTAEKDSIKRVVTNLLDNAIKFSYEKGQIDISTKVTGNKVSVSVRNTGVGISEENRKSIFERFFKQDKSRSVNKSGVGLGLYLVKSIIKKHGEIISVDSVENEYAEFTFTLQKAVSSKSGA
ncbi:cell wall metabolism sensor histidine kinase WalK [Acetivibrio sp. MSJd-27]|jgi:integral membrane sensor signal transduction histidine kinase|uniref:sensor histidine kinase n=1 Tax=Acetivibrio sp. MSJd-27 TaxID=2841523 RepID=UPI0015AF911F|nr:HAMP domain-containing sensor histidine kinase [Acetivibrio sp. MSJd-27]MBU5450346.1 HAMP domain-containing histidine kinase [Acetivibrio sp. MSJd-27]